MSRTMLKWVVVAGLLLLPAFAAAQESGQQEVKTKGASERESSKQQVEMQPADVYRLDYVIHELDNGKQINQRRYSLSTQANGRGCQVRVGRQVPIAVDSTPSGEQKHIQYMSVGMNLDCSVHERGSELVLETSIDMTSVVTGGELAMRGAPVTRQARASMTTLLAPGKPAVIGILDDVDSTRSYEIEVTVTKMK